MYLHTPALEVGSWWRVDTASGSDTATTVYAHDGADAIPTSLGTSGSTVRGNTRDGTAVFWSAAATLYCKELTYQGVPTGTVVTSTGGTPAGPGTTAPVDIATISVAVAALPTTYVKLLVTDATSAVLTGTLVAGHLSPVDCTVGPGIRTLPAASSVAIGTPTVAKKADTTTNTLTVQRAGSDLIFGTGAGSTSKTLTLSGEAVTFVSNGVDRWTVQTSDTPSGAIAAGYAPIAATPVASSATSGTLTAGAEHALSPSSAAAWTLPTGVSATKLPTTVKNNGTAAVTVARGGSDTINGGTASVSIAATEWARFTADGAGAWTQSGTAGQSGTYAQVAGASTGTDDTTKLQALLTAARTAGGGLVRGLPGQTYLVSSALIIGSGTTLDMTGCTVRLKTGSADGRLLINAAQTATATASDGAITSGSATLTTALGAQAVAGQTVVVASAAAGPTPLVALVVTATSNTITLSVNAGATVASAGTVTLYTRDTRIRVIGGIWDKQNNDGTGTTRHTVLLRHIDGLTLADMELRSTAGKYSISIGDCTRVNVLRPFLNNVQSDGVHLSGPCSDVVIRDVSGTTGDDFISITTSDYTAYNDVTGDVTDVLIDGVHPANCLIRGVQLVPSLSGALKRVVVRNVAGYLSTSGTGPAVLLANDATETYMVGGLADDIVVENVSTTVANNQPLIAVTNTQTKRLRINGAAFDNASATNAVVDIAPSAAASVGAIIVQNVQAGSTGGNPLVKVRSNATLARLVVSHCTVSTSSAWDAVRVFGTVTDLAISHILGNAGNGGILVLDGSTNGAAVTRASISHCQTTGTTSSAMIVATASAHTLPLVKISNCLINNVAWVADLNTTTTLHITGTDITTSFGIANIRANATVTMDGDGNNLAVGSNGVKVTSGGKCAVRIWDCPPSTTAGGFPTIAAGAGLGSGPTVVVAGSDRAGTLTLTPGSGAAAGAQATVTFVGTWPQTPKISFAETNAAAQAAGAYLSAKSTTAFTISTANTPGGAMTFDYVVAA